MATSMANNAGQSLQNACTDPASIEGAYRFIRNGNISADDIAQAGHQFTDSIVKQRPLVLVLQDTTGLSYKPKGSPKIIIKFQLHRSHPYFSN